MFFPATFLLFPRISRCWQQAPRKAVQCLQKEVGKNIKVKKRDKRGRDIALCGEGSLKKEKSFQTSGNTLLPSL